MPHFDEYLARSEQVKKRLVVGNLQNPPRIDARWLYRRFQLFRQEVLQPLLKSENEWYQQEWSYPRSLVGFRRSSGRHVPETVPSEAQATFVDFLVLENCRLQPDPNRRPDLKRPFSLLHEKQQNFQDFLSAGLNRFQQHSKRYWLRKIRTPRRNLKHTPIYFAKSCHRSMSVHLYRRFESKSVNKLTGERDWPKQEMCSIILGLPLQ
jgi:hypothetical protein